MRILLTVTRPRTTPRAIAVVMLLALLASLLAPIGEEIAAAQEVDPAATEEAAPPEPTVEAIVPTAPAVEEPVATEDPALLEPTAVPTSQLTISVYRCDHPDFDTGLSSNLQRVINECTGPGNATIAIESGNGAQQVSGSSLTAEILDFLVLQEPLLPGYENSIANCFLYGPDGALVDQIGPGETSGGGWKVGSIRGDVHCDWYQVDRGIGNVYVVNMACPSNAGLFPEPSMTDLVTMCTDPAGAKQFFVVHTGGLERMGVSGGEFNDVLFEAIPAGPIEIWMDDHRAFDSARVFCQVNTLEGVEIAPFAEVKVSSFRATGITLGHGQRLHCSWFNIEASVLSGDIPDLEEAPPTVAPTEPVLLEPSDLIVKKYTCPNNYKPTNPNADPLTDCTPGPDGINFTLSDADPNTVDLQTMTGDSMPNAVQFGGLQPGDYTLTETIPAGTGDIFVLGCGGGGGIDPIPQFIDGTTSIGLPPGVIMTCPWFNVPSPGGGQAIPRIGSPEAETGDTGRIVIQKHVCPDGVPIDPTLGVDMIATTCNTRLEGVDFAAVGQDGYTGSGTSSSTGTVTFEDVPAGEVTITETIPAGYGDPVVYCTAFPPEDEMSGPFPYEQVTAAGGGIARTVEAGIETNCAWFNVPEGLLIEASPIAIQALTGTASLTMAAYACPAGFDVTTVDANPQALCAPLPSITFDINDTIDDNSGRYTETDASGIGTVSDLAADTWTIEAGARNGTTSSFYWDCYDAAGASARTDPLKDGTVIQVEIADGAQVRCDWFAVTGGTARVVIAKHACDYLVPAYTLDQAGLAAQCTIDTGTVNMTVVSDTHQETQPASNNPLTLASFANVPTGNVAVVEDNLAGWATAIVFCGIYDENGTVISPVAQMDVIQSRSIFLNLEPGQVGSCDWYNVAQGFVDVTVNKHLCPEGFDAYAADPAALALGCTQDPGSVKFSLHDESLYYQERTITAAAPGTWTDVPSGDIRIEEMDLPTGYGMPIVVCRVDFEDGSAVSGASFQPITGRTWTYVNLSAGQVLTCDWYNVPGGQGAVSIWKQACPPTVNVAAMSSHELELVCQEDIPAITFDLSVGSFTDSATSTNLFRYADFPAVPRGEVTITERPAAPWDYSVVYCRTQSDTKPVSDEVLVPVSDQGSITHFVDSGDWLICRWYNAYEPTNTVEVIKYTCPEGTGYDEEDRYYAETCTTPGRDGIEFTLTGSDGIGIGYTAGGKVTFDDVPVGPVSIQERIPDDFGQPVVFCGIVSASGGPIDAVAKRVDAPGGYHATTIAYVGTHYLCYWYNIPGGPSDITIHKYWCKPGYDLQAWGADPLKDCTDKANGITFTLEGPGEHPDSATTGDPLDGAIRFDKLEHGTYVITEIVPENTAHVFVFNCYGQTQGELRPTPLSVGERLEIDVSAGEFIECHWYNVPEDPGGRLTVYKHVCSTKVYVSEVDCEIYEDGQDFDLVMWDGDSWGKVDDGTTDGGGLLTWGGIEPGEYWLDEQDGEWCHLTSEDLSDDGNWLNVYDGKETVVHVYNCTGEPGKPGGTPTKYPNTGGATIRDEWRLEP